LRHFTESAKRYHEFLNANNLSVRQDQARGPCQIEKDERFWIATALMKLIKAEASNRVAVLAALLSQAFGPRPPFVAFDDWQSCLTGDQQLTLEASLPSPPSYCSWLRESGSGQHFIPYVERARKRNTEGKLEGATSVDAVIVNVDNGFALLLEAKVLSAISLDVSFDAFRNQIARSLDGMLEDGQELKPLAAQGQTLALCLAHAQVLPSATAFAAIRFPVRRVQTRSRRSCSRSVTPRRGLAGVGTPLGMVHIRGY
jgi:hypothetical protein